MKKGFVFCYFILFSLAPVFAHTIGYELDKIPAGNVFIKYLQLGFTHILPFGFDHVLFILCVFFMNTDIKKIILQATMFTVAHTITLGLAIYGIIKPPAHIIEPLIAISIVFLALDNIFSDNIKPWRLLMVFLFGLVHGMGFASVLTGLGMPQYAFGIALFSFNFGVELGQLTIIIFMYVFVSKLFSQKMWYRSRLVVPLSILIALTASYWTVQRIFFM